MSDHIYPDNEYGRLKAQKDAILERQADQQAIELRRAEKLIRGLVRSGIIGLHGNGSLWTLTTDGSKELWATSQSEAAIAVRAVLDRQEAE